MNEYELFELQCQREIAAMGEDKALAEITMAWRLAARQYQYTYHFRWMGRPIIQQPQDIIAFQELIWTVKPDLIVETGIAHGGSLVFSASMLTLLDYWETVEQGKLLDPNKPRRQVIGIDIDIRAHNRAAIQAHPMFTRIQMIEGSSIDPNVITQVKAVANEYKRILVCLDSMHTHDHVLAELVAYAPLVSPYSYCVVFDTIIEDMPDDMFSDRPWGKGNNPKTAVWEYLRRLKEDGQRGKDGKPLHFEVDKNIEHKLLITVAPNGYLKRVEKPSK